MRFADEYERVDGFIESDFDLTTYDLAGEDDLEEFVDDAFSSFVFENLLLRASILYFVFFPI